MKSYVFNKLENISTLDKTIICLGAFDSIHLGHQKLLSETLKISKESNLKTIFFNFNNIKENKLPKKPCIMDNDLKAEIASTMGFDYFLTFNATKKNLRISANDFLILLQQHYRVQKVVIGNDFRFGHKVKGDYKLLQNFFGVDNVIIIDDVLVDGQKLSSSIIRKYLENNQFIRANKLMIQPFTVKGTVVKNKQIGRVIDFPTINLIIPEKLLINFGTYYSKTLVNNVWYHSMSCYRMVNKKLVLETHIINFDKDIYGQDVKVYIIDLMRPNVRFNNQDDLQYQLNIDLKNTVEYFNLLK